MNQELNNLLHELRLQGRFIGEEEIEFILGELLKEMAAGGFDTKISLKLKFFFDTEGRPFVQAQTSQSIPQTSLFIGENFELPFNINGELLTLEEFYITPAKHPKVPDILPTQKHALLNVLINFQVMCVVGLYDQIKNEYFKNKFLITKNYKERNEIRKKIRDRAETNLFRATFGETSPDVGRPQKTPEQIEIEKTNFLRRLYSAFEKWKLSQKSNKYTKSKKTPTQSAVSVYLVFSKAVAVEKKLSETLKLYDLDFKQLWKNFLETKNSDDFLRKMSYKK